MCNVWINVKLRGRLIFIYYIFFLQQGITGVPGGRWSTKTAPRDPCARTCWALVVHLGAFKSQLVATIAYIYIHFAILVIIYIYIYIYNFGNCTWWDSVPNGSLQWSSSCLVCVCVCMFLLWEYVNCNFGTKHCRLWFAKARTPVREPGLPKKWFGK